MTLTLCIDHYINGTFMMSLNLIAFAITYRTHNAYKTVSCLIVIK